MKNLILILVCFSLIYSCSNNSHMAEFEKNTELAKTYFKLHEEENAEEMFNYLHPEMKWHMPFYGMNMGGINDVKAAVSGFQKEFDNMKFTADYWLPGVNTNTGEPDGSTRVYGTWTATHTKTGKRANLTSYHSFEFKDGKIINGGDWFDLGGMIDTYNNHEQEIINIAQMTTTLSDEEVEEFSKNYQKAVFNLEPTSLSFRFTKTGKNQVTLIERYKDSDAVLLHIKNISPGGLLDDDFEMFTKVFSINNMTMYGDVSEELKNVISAFQIPTSYKEVIAGYSR